DRLLAEYRRLIALRRSSPALARGGIRYLHVCDDAIAYLRETRYERLLCLAARAPHDPISVPFRELETVYGEDARDGALPGDGPASHVGRWGVCRGRPRPPPARRAGARPRSWSRVRAGCRAGARRPAPRRGRSAPPARSRASASRRRRRRRRSWR